MKKIPVDQIENGMVLEKEICGPSGNVLIGKGAAISGAMARRLKNWGIEEIFVEGEDENAGAEGDNGESPEKVKEILEKKFSNCIDDAYMKQIFVAVYKFKTDQVT